MESREQGGEGWGARGREGTEWVLFPSMLPSQLYDEGKMLVGRDD